MALRNTNGLTRYSQLLLIALAFFSFNTLAQAQLTGLPNLKTVTEAPGASTTGKSSSSSKSSASKTSAQAVTTTTTSGAYAHLSNIPTLAGVGVPPLIVPDTSGASFMQKSNLPEGTVFICVGAALGFLGLAILAWRGLVAWSLQRSVQRAARSQYASETKSSSYRASGYHNMYDSNMSLEHLAHTKTSYAAGDGDDSNAREKQRYSKSHQPKSRRQSRQPGAQSGLFFSPTAAGMNNQSNRSSSYLPAGYYASGTSTTAGGAAIAHIGGPPAAGYARMSEVAPSPPLSPGVPPEPRYRDRERESYLDRRGAGMRYDNTDRSSINLQPTPRVSRPGSRNPSAPGTRRNSLNQQGPQSGRSPSTFLDNVLDTHGSAMSER